MAHFAQINENNIVTQVIVVSNDDCGGGDFPDSESVGQQFISDIGLDGLWKQTSYNNNFRKRFAGIGFTYDEERDAFICLPPYPSWVLDENNNWQAPIPKPEEGNWEWDEEQGNWREIVTE